MRDSIENLGIVIGCFASVATALLGQAPAQASILTQNSSSVAGNPASFAAWLKDIGIGEQRVQYLVDFESGFAQNQNVSGVAGLFPGTLIITDTTTADLARISGMSAHYGGSNPVDTLAVSHNEGQYLELDFTARPVDYVSFNDIDHSGTTIIVHFDGGGSATTSIETTATSGNTAEFFGVFRNDMPHITRIQLDASGDGAWGIDNIRYGRVLEPGDINGDGMVDVDDLIAVILAWGPCPAPPALCPADTNNSGAVDVDDLIAVILNWG